MNTANIRRCLKKLSNRQKLAIVVVVGWLFLRFQADRILEVALRQSIRDRNPNGRNSSGRKELLFVSVNGHDPSFTFPYRFLFDGFRVARFSQAEYVKGEQLLPYGGAYTARYTGEFGTPVRLTYSPFSFPPKVEVAVPGWGATYVIGIKNGRWAVIRNERSWIS